MKSNKSPMPKWAKAPEWIIAYFEKAMSDHPGVELRKMFGYPVAFIHGQMACGVFQSSLMMRLSETDRAEFLEKYHTKLFEPMPGRPMKEYVLIPESLMNEPGKLSPWIKRSLDFTGSLLNKERVKAKSKQRRRESD
jgi:TfoX/Sxy family transcriptional regulator of competence genes